MNKKYWLWLDSIDGMTSKWFYYIISCTEDPENVFFDSQILDKAEKLPEKIKNNIKKFSSGAYLDDFLAYLEKKEIKTVCSPENSFPYPLSDVSDIPPVIYYKGILPDNWERAVSIVGTRNPTPNGYSTIKKLSYDLARHGITIVSGMAAGLDSAAHSGAVEAGGTTVAVLGSGADIVYPEENRELYDKIIENGAVISRFRPGSKAIPINFPIRNMIVAALSKIIIAGEAKTRSGVRITVDDGISLGKTIYALPCDISSDVSALPNRLIKDGAEMLLSYKDILEEFGIEEQQASKKTSAKKNIKLDFFEKEIYNLLLKGNLTAEKISESLKRPINEINTALTMMELKGSIICRPGNVFAIK